MKSQVCISLYSCENTSECVLSIVLNTEQTVDECQDVLMQLFPKLRQEIKAPRERIHNDDVNM